MKKFWISLAAIVVLIVVVFLFVNFHVMQSKTFTNSAIASGGSPDNIGNPSTTALWVGGDHLADSVRNQIKRLAQNQPHFGEISMLNAIADKFDLPVLVVDIQKQQYIWTPFYARSVYHLVVSYASNGDISFRNEQPTHFVLKDPPSFQLQGNYTVDDTSWGLISSPGYRDYMNGKIADQVVKSLQEKFK